MYVKGFCAITLQRFEFGCNDTFSPKDLQTILINKFGGGLALFDEIIGFLADSKEENLIENFDLVYF